MDGNKFYRIDSAVESMKVGISEEALAKIAAIAAMETDGVACLAGNITKDMIAKLSHKKLVPGVHVTVYNKKIDVGISLVITYGFELRAVADCAQEKIRTMIETMTGYTISSIVIKIANIDTDEN